MTKVEVLLQNAVKLHYQVQDKGKSMFDFM